MKLLINGANGQLGSELVRRARAAGHQVTAWTRRELDLATAAQIGPLLARIDPQPEVLINAAAYTQVDRAEMEPELAFAVNRDGVARLAEASAAIQLPLLHVSTDYVFDGCQTRPYREDDPVAPIGVYGTSKWAGEQALRTISTQQQQRFAIVRTSWVFGIDGQNFVKTMLRLGRERDQLQVVADQRGRPTYAGALAEALLALAEQLFSSDSVSGTYHYADSPATTWYDLAAAVFELAEQHHALPAPTLTPISTADYPTPAARPAYSVLDCNRLAERCGIVARPWREGLAEMLSVIMTPEQRSGPVDR